ncbi:hypothetical protein [Blastococcus sp. LR1]|uniref:hypothetical protein n=1 Tax=Blastococcus sp. LR1 TaxID=2877000 RepID=UPI001CC9B19C|nr:hypothetical protein [Blastococcus sp. LR1]MCA0145867.1 hypothetical protein [Blastococcus sp. LR1]
MAAAAVLLVACGGSDEEEAGTSSASATTAEPADPEFCTAAASIQERLQATVSDQSDPTRLPAILDEAASEIRAIQAPDEISGDWAALAGGVEQFSAAIAGIDFTDPDALTTLDQQLTPLQQQLGAASTNVGDYLRDECGIEDDATG